MTKIKLKTQWLNPVELLTSPINPRTIDEKQFEKLKASLSAFPEMMEIRPIVINAENEVLGGNMRLLAAIDLKWPKVPVIDVSALPIEKQKEFMIRDNVQHGQWDYDMLANEWESDTLNDWGLAVWSPDELKNDFEEESSETIQGHKPRATDDDYSVFELIMLHDNKLKLIEVLTAVKEKHNIEKQEDALMHIVKTYANN